MKKGPMLWGGGRSNIEVIQVASMPKITSFKEQQRLEEAHSCKTATLSRPTYHGHISSLPVDPSHGCCFIHGCVAFVVWPLCWACLLACCHGCCLENVDQRAAI